MACPYEWLMRRQGAQGRVMDESAMEAGTQFHALMASWWTQGYADLSEAPSLERVFDRVIDQEGPALQERGVVGVEVNLDGDDEEAKRHGRYPGTADLITDNGAGLTVTDYKTKRTLPDVYVDRELRQTARSWQLYQYAHFAQIKYGRPVTKIRKLLVRFAPTVKVWLHAVDLTQPMLDHWYADAREVWVQMDRMAGWSPKQAMRAWRNPSACERFGWEWRCSLFEHCWDGMPLTFEESDNE